MAPLPGICRLGGGRSIHCPNASRLLLPRLDTLILGQHSRCEILEAKSPSSASTVKMEVEGRKGDTILTGADEMYHDEAFRAKASPFSPILNANNFLEISICKPKNFLTFPLHINAPVFSSVRTRAASRFYRLELRVALRVGLPRRKIGPASVSKWGAESGARRRDDMRSGAGAQRRALLADGSERYCVFGIPRKERAGGK
jgi:hypothetical protein